VVTFKAMRRKLIAFFSFFRDTSFASPNLANPGEPIDTAIVYYGKKRGICCAFC
jgi:hypothetical protein